MNNLSYNISTWICANEGKGRWCLLLTVSHMMSAFKIVWNLSLFSTDFLSQSCELLVTWGIYRTHLYHSWVLKVIGLDWNSKNTYWYLAGVNNKAEGTRCFSQVNEISTPHLYSMTNYLRLFMKFQDLWFTR